jgi:uncharacterized protein YndB with AHSA1/START domain
MAELNISTPAGLPFVDVTRDFDAPRDLVFRAHTDPDLLVQWLGPRRYRLDVERLEVRDGGSWRYIHTAEDGGSHAFHGVFHGAPTAERIVQTFEYEGAPGNVSLDQFDLEDLGGGRTRLRAHSVFQSVEARDSQVSDGMQEGMVDSYERLDELLARHVPVA